ncbi:aa3-type cytochrome oxidase subunit II [Glycomyces albidus]|jgi:cytochrome c oxidase subunit 2|uniref:cytochrome-c oxidase n=1 Tax=Glycomyces albidus TaxID=2656774 RepID=A0A6L5GED7_9ACTN|nr:cytochrome c oxidase subunit II [Glycomyces albidus]MQM27783.1 cytochrome c oxidase subunit II [Glycomyces albidus]
MRQVVGKPSRERRGRARRAIGLTGIAALLPILLAGCSVADAFYFGWPRTTPTTQSEQMFDLWIGSTIAALAVGVVVWGLTFWCIAAYKKKDTDTELPRQTKYNLPAELTFTALPFVLIGVLFYYTVIVQDNVTKMSEQPSACTEITAFKWNWQFTYTDENCDPLTGADGQPVTETGDSDYIPIIVVPNQDDVRFTAHAEDVIHSFWVPDLLFKRDVFPGSDNSHTQWEVDFNSEGTFVGRCAELCGAYHAFMNFEMRVVSPEDYQTFVDARVDGASTPEALELIGQEPYATTTHPFDTDPASGEAS